jgi:hypothetical protein
LHSFADRTVTIHHYEMMELNSIPSAQSKSAVGLTTENCCDRRCSSASPLLGNQHQRNNQLQHTRSTWSSGLSDYALGYFLQPDH